MLDNLERRKEETYMREIYKKYMQYWNMVNEGSFIDTDGNKIRLCVFKELGEDLYNLIRERIEQKLKEYQKRLDEELLEYMKVDFIEKLRKEGKL